MTQDGWIQESHCITAWVPKTTSHHKKPAKCANMSMLIRSISYSPMLISLISYSSKYLHPNHTFHMVNVNNSLPPPFFSFWRRLANMFSKHPLSTTFQVTESNDRVLYGPERQDKGGGSGQITAFWRREEAEVGVGGSYRGCPQNPTGSPCRPSARAGAQRSACQTVCSDSPEMARRNFPQLYTSCSPGALAVCDSVT